MERSAMKKGRLSNWFSCIGRRRKKLIRIVTTAARSSSSSETVVLTAQVSELRLIVGYILKTLDSQNTSLFIVKNRLEFLQGMLSASQLTVGPSPSLKETSTG